MKTFCTKHLSTVSAEEVLRMPGLVHGRQYFIQNRSSTVSTAWRKKVVVVLGAVGQASPLKEGTGANLFFAVSADEVLWMPRLP